MRCIAKIDTISSMNITSFFNNSTGSRTGSGDYQVTETDLVLGPYTTQLTVDISINNDNLLEFNETFSSLLFLQSLTPRVTVNPNTTQITIVDYDS